MSGIIGSSANMNSGLAGAYPPGHVLQVKTFEGTGSSSTTGDLTVSNTYWSGSAYPSITVNSGNYIFVMLEFRYNIYGGSNDSQGTWHVYDITNSASKGHYGNAYTAHTGNETSGIWNYAGYAGQATALWTDSSAAAVQLSTRMIAASGGTLVFNGGNSHMIVMEVQA